MCVKWMESVWSRAVSLKRAEGGRSVVVVGPDGRMAPDLEWSRETKLSCSPKPFKYIIFILTTTEKRPKVCAYECACVLVCVSTSKIMLRIILNRIQENVWQIYSVKREKKIYENY